MIFDGNNIYGYLDGTQIAKSEQFSSGKIGYNSKNSIIVGGEPTGAYNTVQTGSYFFGKIGNVVISNSDQLIPTTTYNTFTAPQQDVTLYARWEAN